MQNVMQRAVTVLAGAMLGAGMLCFASPAKADVGSGDLIINEFNAVGPTKNLEQGFDPAFGTGPVLGNGGDWVELLVVTDHLNIAGWTLNWENVDPSGGSLTFTSAWSSIDLRAGTLIILRTDGSFATNASYSPGACGSGDWLIEISATDTTYVTRSGDAFKTDNDGWIGQILDDSSNLVQDFVGETQNPNSVIWAGSGINSQEVGKLEADPTTLAADPSEATSTGHANYEDGNCSSYGKPNCWDDGASHQDFSGLYFCP